MSIFSKTKANSDRVQIEQTGDFPVPVVLGEKRFDPPIKLSFAEKLLLCWKHDIPYAVSDSPEPPFGKLVVLHWPADVPQDVKEALQDEPRRSTTIVRNGETIHIDSGAVMGPEMIE